MSKEKSKRKSKEEIKKEIQEDAQSLIKRKSPIGSKEYAQSSLKDIYARATRANPEDMNKLSVFLRTKNFDVFQKIYEQAMAGDANLLKYLGDLVYSKDKILVSEEQTRHLRSLSDLERIDFILNLMLEGKISISAASRAVGAFKSKAEYKQSLLDIEAIEERMQIIEAKFTSIAKNVVESEIIVESKDVETSSIKK